MDKIKFQNHWVPARKDLLQFLEDWLDSEKIEDMYRSIGEIPERWIEELSFIHFYLTGSILGGVSGLDLPPLGHPDCVKLGEKTFLYRGDYNRLRGLWITRENKSLEEITNDPSAWFRYKIGSTVPLRINEEFSNLTLEEFLPENFEKNGERVKKDHAANKRPIIRFNICIGGETIVIYAKGAYIAPQLYYDYAKPSYRLTPLAGVSKVSSKTEMKRLVDLAEKGVKVPQVVGYYGGDVEEFLFLKEVKGKYPSEYICSHRGVLIEQDAKILAALCKLGLGKHGFCDFDDKIFDGQDLYLIDVEECSNFYSEQVFSVDFREVLIDPTSQRLGSFRKYQTSMFRTFLRDALYGYRDSLVRNPSDQRAYITTFFAEMGWEITDTDIKDLTTFPEPYTTWDSHVCMMHDE